MAPPSLTKGQQAVLAREASREQFFTTHFEKDEQFLPKYVQLAKDDGENVARQCGTYFEVCVYEAFGKIEGVNVTPDGLSANQKQIKNFFETDKSTAVKEQAKAIRNAAQIAVQTWCKNFEKRIQDEGLTITMTADEQRGNKLIGNPFGDLLAQLGKEKISLELKWQMQIDNEIKYFHAVSELTLFKGGYKKFLSDNFLEYWNNDIQRKEWTEKISTEGLSNFLNIKFNNNARQILTYLLHKGEMRFSRQDRYYDSKYVIRGTSVSVQLVNIEALGRALGNSGKLQDTGRRTQSAGRFNKEKGTYSLVKNLGVLGFYNSYGAEMAIFGMKDFSGGSSGLFSGDSHNEKLRRGNRAIKEDVARKAISQARFSFYMYLNSRLFNDLFIK